MIFPELEKYALYEGERLRGKVGLCKLKYRQNDSIYINKKLYLTKRGGFVKYTAPRQPPGRYSLIVSGKERLKKPTGQDTLFRICDTLYYIVE